MNWRDLWYDNTTGRLRSGWRALVFILVTMTVAIPLLITIVLPLQTLLHTFPHTRLLIDEAYMSLLIMAIILVPALLFAGFWALRTLDRLPARTLGIALAGPWLRSLLLGLGIGIGLIALLLLTGWFAGIAEIQPHLPTGREWATLAIVTVILLLSAMQEELLVHGYLFQTLLRGAGPLFALLLTSTFATALHASNPNSSPLGLTNVFLAMVMFGMLYLRMGNLWLPIGLHAGWNLGMLLFHVPISGITIDLNTPFAIVFSGNPLLTGGAFGLEGGIAVSVVMLLLIALLAYTRRGLPLASYWWEWRSLTPAPRTHPSWDFTIGTRHYQWKLLEEE